MKKVYLFVSVVVCGVSTGSSPLYSSHSIDKESLSCLLKVGFTVGMTAAALECSRRSCGDTYGQWKDWKKRVDTFYQEIKIACGIDQTAKLTLANASFRTLRRVCPPDGTISTDAVLYLQQEGAVMQGTAIGEECARTWLLPLREAVEEYFLAHPPSSTSPYHVVYNFEYLKKSILPGVTSEDTIKALSLFAGIEKPHTDTSKSVIALSNMPEAVNTLLIDPHQLPGIQASIPPISDKKRFLPLAARNSIIGIACHYGEKAETLREEFDTFSPFLRRRMVTDALIVATGLVASGWAIATR